MGLPRFYINEGTDNGNETLQDFVLSWTFRCSEEQYRLGNEKVNEFSRRTIYFLIHGSSELGQRPYSIDSEIPDDFQIEKVTTFRQWNQIDLLVEIKLKGIETLFVLNIENKVYTYPNAYQLEKSVNAIKKSYDTSKIKVKNLLLYADNFFEKYPNKHSEIKSLCKGYNYELVTKWPEILEYASKNIKETENIMFDEFWF
jgi:hypothetical protein